ncbi:TPA: ead/Ea22-like family protein [Enterobacter asburiae]
MSNIDKLKSAAAKAVDNFDPNMFVETRDVLALLDELEASEKLNAELMEKQRLIDICQGQGLEHRIAAEKRAEAAEKRIAELESDNAYIRNRHKELDLLIGKNILVMQAAIIEWQGTGDARKGLAWIYNTLFGPGELPDESEKDAQAYFDRKYAPLDEELMNLHRWFWEQSEAERAAAAGKGEAS